MFRSLIFTVLFRHSLARALTVTLLAAVRITSLAQTPNGKQYTSTLNDINERSSVEVDPSSLGMNISISLADFAGRGVSLPVTLRYSSKIWRIKYGATQAQQASCAVSHYILNHESFQNSQAGWTSSLSVPYIEFSGWNEGFIARFTNTGHDISFPDDGEPWDNPQTVNGSEPLLYFANRAILHMPDGSSHELRQDDLVYLDSNGLANRMYYAVDGSRVKYDPVNQTVFLPDGSQYQLNTANGARYVDRVVGKSGGKQ